MEIGSLHTLHTLLSLSFRALKAHVMSYACMHMRSPRRGQTQMTSTSFRHFGPLITVTLTQPICTSLHLIFLPTHPHSRANIICECPLTPRALAQSPSEAFSLGSGCKRASKRMMMLRREFVSLISETEPYQEWCQLVFFRIQCVRTGWALFRKRKWRKVP